MAVEHWFKIRPRTDGEPGFEVVTRTTQKYVEPDNRDVRVKRVFVFDSNGRRERSFLEDEMGVPFKDRLEDWL